MAAAAAASAAAESATAEERSGIARAQALEVAKTLGMSEEQMEAAGDSGMGLGIYLIVFGCKFGWVWEYI